MADKKNLSLMPCTTSSRAGASGLLMNDGEVISPRTSTTKSLGFSILSSCTQVEEEEAFTGEEGAPSKKKKKKATTAGPKGRAAERKGGCGLSKIEDAAAEEAAAEKAAVTVVADEKMEPKASSYLEQCKAEYAQYMDELFGNGPNAIHGVRFVDHAPFMILRDEDYWKKKKEEGELGSVDDGTSPPVSN